MARTLRISAAAVADIERIGDYIAVDNPERAAGFVDELATKIETLSRRPLSFPASPDLPHGLRSALHGRYRIIFMVTEQTVDVVCIVHGARNLPSIIEDTPQ